MHGACDLPAGSLPLCDAVDAAAHAQGAREAQELLLQQLSSLGHDASTSLVLYNLEVMPLNPTSRTSCTSALAGSRSSLYTSTTQRKVISIKVCVVVSCWVR